MFWIYLTAYHNHQSQNPHDPRDLGSAELKLTITSLSYSHKLPHYL
jgi:hypothetical protein